MKFIGQITLGLTLVASGASGQDTAVTHSKLADKLISLEIIGRDSAGRDVSALGTGFIVHPAGYAVTAAHLFDDLIKKGAIENTLKITARIGDFTGSPISAGFVESNKHDIALIRLATRVSGYSPARIMCSSNFDIGNLRMLTSGFGYTCTTFDTSSRTCLDGRMQATRASGELGSTSDSVLADTYDLNLSFQYGNSGSPVYVQNGVVVGVVKGNVESAPGRSVFVPITWADAILRQVPGLPACYDPTPCINGILSVSNTQAFTVSGGARAPGTGTSVNSVAEEKAICYAAPPGFSIEGQVTVKDDGNNGGRGAISAVQYKTGLDGRVVGACVPVKAWSEAKPFGAGGWQYVTITGLISRNSLARSQLTNARAECLKTDD